jgi:hypothetical protein
MSHSLAVLKDQERADSEQYSGHKIESKGARSRVAREYMYKAARSVKRDRDSSDTTYELPDAS